MLLQTNKHTNPYKICYYRNSHYSVAFRFGAITMVSGIIGVPLGTYLTQKLKKNSCRNDPIVCACGLLISAPLLAGSMLMITASEPIAYLLVFFGEIALNLNWAIVADMLLVRMTFFFVSLLLLFRILATQTQNLILLLCCSFIFQNRLKHTHTHFSYQTEWNKNTYK